MNKANSNKQPKKEFQSSLIAYLALKNKPATTPPTHNQPIRQTLSSKHDENDRQSEKTPAATKQKRISSSNKSRQQQMSSPSAKSSSPQLCIIKKQHSNQKKPQPIQPKQQLCVNVLFYLNRISSQPCGQYIDKMHQLWVTDYDKLERDHAFIQWIFPNSYQSRFNPRAKPLTPKEAEQFRTNPEIIDRYLKSYDMMLGFYGMRLKDRHTGEIMRSRYPDFKQRMHKTLLTSFHNHMRVTRILCSLTQTGFGLYAAQLCKFLKYQIYDRSGFMNSLQKHNAYRDWQPFELYVEGKSAKNVYLENINRKKEQPRVIELQHKTEQVKAMTRQDKTDEQKVEQTKQQNLKEKQDPCVYANPARKEQK